MTAETTVCCGAELEWDGADEGLAGLADGVGVAALAVFETDDVGMAGEGAADLVGGGVSCCFAAPPHAVRHKAAASALAAVRRPRPALRRPPLPRIPSRTVPTMR